MVVRLRTMWFLVLLRCSQPSSSPDASVAPLDDSILLTPWELRVQAGLFATTDAGLRFVLSDRADLCASLGPVQCVRTGTLDDVLTPGVSLQVLVSGTNARVYEFPEVSAKFLGASTSNRFVANARAGRVEVVGSPPSILSVDLVLETGATVKGRFAIVACEGTALVRPFGGLSCNVTSVPRDCDGGSCTEVTERCTCGSTQWTGVCQRVDTAFSNGTSRTGMSCQCNAPTATSPCSIDDAPTSALTYPTCCRP